MIGRSIQDKQDSKPEHQMTLLTFNALPSAKRGRPSLTPSVRATRLMPARTKSLTF